MQRASLFSFSAMGMSTSEYQSFIRINLRRFCEKRLPMTEFGAPLGGNRQACAVIMCAAFEKRIKSRDFPQLMERNGDEIADGTRGNGSDARCSASDLISHSRKTAADGCAAFFSFHFLPSDILETALAMLCAPPTMSLVQPAAVETTRKPSLSGSAGRKCQTTAGVNSTRPPLIPLTSLPTLDAGCDVRYSGIIKFMYPSEVELFCCGEYLRDQLVNNYVHDPWKNYTRGVTLRLDFGGFSSQFNDQKPRTRGTDSTTEEQDDDASFNTTTSRHVEVGNRTGTDRYRNTHHTIQSIPAGFLAGLSSLGDLTIREVNVDSIETFSSDDGECSSRGSIDSSSSSPGNGITSIGRNFLAHCTSLTRLQLLVSPTPIIKASTEALPSPSPQFAAVEGSSIAAATVTSSTETTDEEVLSQSATAAAAAAAAGSHPSGSPSIPPSIHQFHHHNHSLTLNRNLHFQSLTSVGPGFLQGCIALCELDISHCCRLATAGEYFLADCSSMRRTALPTSLIHLQSRGFLSGCHSLVEVVSDSPTVQTCLPKHLRGGQRRVGGGVDAGNVGMGSPECSSSGVSAAAFALDHFFEDDDDFY